MSVSLWRDIVWPTITGLPGILAALRSYGTLDARKQTAIWVARWFKLLPQARPGVTADEVIRMALEARYLRSGNGRLFAVSADAINQGRVKTARDLCHLLADLELLAHLTPEQRVSLEMQGENIVAHTYRVMDEQLARDGLLPSLVVERLP
jgi:hypothetical protein